MLEFRSKKSKPLKKLTIMNDQDQWVLYTNASTKAIAGVLMQVQAGTVFIPVTQNKHQNSNLMSSFTASIIYLPTYWENNLLSEPIIKTWCIWLIQWSRHS